MDIGWPEILIIAAVVLVLFGSKKLPDAARSLGRSARILKTELKDLHDDDDPAKNEAAQASALPPPPVVPVTPVVPAAPVASEAPAQPVSTSDQSSS